MLFSQHTACISAIPDSKSSSRATSLALGDVILLISLFNLLRSDLYSLNLARSTAFTPGCKLLASRSIFRIWKQSNQITSFRNKNSNKTPNFSFYFASKRKEAKFRCQITKPSASSNPALISENFCCFCPAIQIEPQKPNLQNLKPDKHNWKHIKPPKFI